MGKLLYHDEEGDWTPVSDWITLGILMAVSGGAVCVFMFLRCLWRHWRG
jgi:hypothetical protein